MLKLFTTVAAGLFATGLTAGTILEDARQILGDGGDFAKKWMFNPKVQVFYEEEWVRDTVIDQLRYQEELTGLTFDIESTKVTYDDGIRAIGRSAWGRLKNSLPGGPQSSVFVLGEDKKWLEGNIFVFTGPFEFTSHAMQLASGSAGVNLTYNYAAGRIPCFFHLRSSVNSAQFSFVYVSDRIAPSDVKSCIYEELMQAMGFLNDADGTPYFTFDDKPEDKSKDLDAALMRALYSPQVEHGHNVDEVVEIFSEIIDERKSRQSP